jgi:hypothetical protein
MMDLWLPPAKPAIIRAHKEASFLPGMFPGGAAAATPDAIRTFVHSAGDASNLSSYTFASVPLGSSNQYTRIFVAVYSNAGNNVTATSVSVAGNAATIRNSANSSDVLGVSIWNIAYAAGGSQTIQVGFGGTQVRCAIGVWGTTGVINLPPTDTAQSTADPAEAAIDIFSGGLVFVAGIVDNTLGAIPIGVDEDLDTTVESGISVFGGSLASGGVTGLSVGCNVLNLGSNIQAMCAAAFR